MPRNNVTVLAQVTAGAFGTGWMFYVSNLAVTAVLAFAANTSFGGLPVLMSLLAKDHRLPHLFYLRAEHPVYRHGIIALALAAMLLLIAVDGDTDGLIPLFTIGVFVGLTISQVGLVRHWRRDAAPALAARATLNGAGAAMTAVAVLVFLFTKFLGGAWVVCIAVPLLMWLFSHTESYYARGGRELKLGRTPAAPAPAREHRDRPDLDGQPADRARAQRGAVARRHRIALAVAGDEEERQRDRARMAGVGVRGPDRGADRPPASLIRTVLRYIESLDVRRRR